MSKNEIGDGFWFVLTMIAFIVIFSVGYTIGYDKKNSETYKKPIIPEIIIKIDKNGKSDTTYIYKF